MQEKSRILTRIAISLVVLWFGINQLLNPEDFMGYLPEFILATEYAKTAVIANGIFEIIFGTLLIIGLFTRITALILTIHLLSITITLGYNDIAIRDLGLTLVTFAIFLGGKDKWCIDTKYG